MFLNLKFSGPRKRRPHSKLRQKRWIWSSLSFSIQIRHFEGVKANRIKYLLQAILCLVILFWIGGCAGFHEVIGKNEPEYEAEIQSWQRAIEGKGGNGMWLVTRGYRWDDNLVAISTCSYFSHVGILDHDRNVVIESLWPGNVETPLRDFLRISHHVVLIQAKGWTPEKVAKHPN